ncbi:MAG: delta-60 repeat domain-containing protein [Flavobacteriales bacterium]
MNMVASSTLLATTICAQIPFSLDTTFRTVIGQQYVNSVLPLPDGKLIASGIMRFPDEFSDKRLVRLLPDGTRDESFYNSGLGGGLISWQADKFYVNAGIPRRILLPSGNNDPTFAVGVMSIPYFSSLQGGDCHVYPDGRVLVSGKHTLSDTARGFVGNYNLIWFTNTGYLDTTRVHRRGQWGAQQVKGTARWGVHRKRFLHAVRGPGRGWRVPHGCRGRA